MSYPTQKNLFRPSTRRHSQHQLLLAEAPGTTSASMDEMKPTLSRISVRLAASAAEVLAAQRLRYKVFYEERGALADVDAVARQCDAESFDDICEHLIVVDQARADAGIDAGVVGNYRLLRGDRRHNPDDAFYTSREFDISKLQQSPAKLLELGRSCVLRDYRQRSVLQLLWTALAGYVQRHGIDIMFGCASFHGSDASLIEQQLAYLHHYHLAHPSLRPHAIGAEALPMDGVAREELDPVRALRRMEPLIRGYLRLGAKVGLGAYRDRPFNTIDVCVVLPTADLAARYARHYEREGDFVLQRPAGSGAACKAAGKPHDDAQ